MNSKVMGFLSELTLNNNRDWFAENKGSFDEARNVFLNVVEQLIVRMGEKHPEFLGLKAKDAIFRIYRDVRFSKDKLPYKTHFGAFLAPGGRKSPFGGHYLHVEPGNSFLAGGVYHAESDNLKAIRNEIYFNLSEFKQIIDDPQFKILFGEIRGESLKRPPVGFPKDFEGVEYLKLKDFTLVHPISDQQIDDGNFLDQAVSVFEAMSALNAFLNRGIANKPDLL